MRTVLRSGVIATTARLASGGLILIGMACRAAAGPGDADARPSAAPPTQPTDGPGGAQYAHGGVTTRHIGDGDSECWIFLPRDPVPKEAPVVVFLHGWGGMKPGVYGAWIRHLVRRGNIVIYPRYQASLRDKPGDMTTHAYETVRNAWKSLLEDKEIQPRKDKIAYVGHSLGGILTANFLARSAALGLPPAGAALMVEPSNGEPMIKRADRVMKIEDVSRAPADALVVAMVGDSDKLAAEFAAKKIMGALAQIPHDNKNYLVVHSDSTAGLVADHLSPTCPDASITDEHEDAADDDDLIDLLGETNNESAAGDRPARREGPLRKRLEERRAQKSGGAGARGNRKPVTDALDWYAYWKVCDGLLDACYSGTNREYALGRGPEVRNMGKTADGHVVSEIEVRDLP